MIHEPGMGGRRYAAMMLVASFFWSSGFLFMKLAEPAHPFVMAAFRATVAAAVLAAWFLARGSSPMPSRREIGPWLLLGTTNGWVPNVLTAYALLHIDSSLSAMIQSSGPVLVAVISHFAFADERLTPRRLGGVLVGFAGMAVLIGPSALAGAGGGAVGIACMVAASLSYAFGNVFARTVRHLEPTRLAFGQQLVSAASASVVAATAIGREAFVQVAGSPWSLLALALLATVIPTTVFMSLIRTYGPTRAALIGYLLPVWATLLAVVFLGESVGVREIAGAGIILAGVWIVSTAPRRG